MRAPYLCALLLAILAQPSPALGSEATRPASVSLSAGFPEMITVTAGYDVWDIVRIGWAAALPFTPDVITGPELGVRLFTFGPHGIGVQGGFFFNLAEPQETRMSIESTGWYYYAAGSYTLQLGEIVFVMTQGGAAWSRDGFLSPQVRIGSGVRF